MVVSGYSYPTSPRAYLNVLAALCVSQIMAVWSLFVYRETRDNSRQEIVLELFWCVNISFVL